MYTFDMEWVVDGDVQLRRRLVGIDERLQDFSEPFEEMTGVVEDENRNQFATEGEPRWPKLSDDYAEQKRRRWGFTTILIASGALLGALVHRTARGAIAVIKPTEMRRGSSIEVGKTRKWNLGWLHYRGTDTMPAREPMRLRPQAQRKMTGIMHRWMTAQGDGSA